jgi:hypothetical protein
MHGPKSLGQVIHKGVPFIDQLQAYLDLWIREYYEQRPHYIRHAGDFGKTTMQTSLPRCRWRRRRHHSLMASDTKS